MLIKEVVEIMRITREYDAEGPDPPADTCHCGLPLIEEQYYRGGRGYGYSRVCIDPECRTKIQKPKLVITKAEKIGG